MSEQTKKVNLELEIDTNMVDSSKNRYQGLIGLQKAIKINGEYLLDYFYQFTYIYCTK